MRVLVVSHYFWPEGFRINQVVEDLIAAGADVTVLTGHPSYPEGHTFPGYDARTTRKQLHPAGYPIFRVPVVPRGDGGAVRLLLNYVSFVVTGILCGTWLLRGRKFDTVFVYANSPVIQGYVGVWFKWIKRARLVQWIQDLWPQALSATGFIKSPAALSIVRKAIAFMYHRSDLILGQSHAFVDYIRKDAGKVPVEFFPNPGEHAPPPGAEAVVKLPAGKFNVVFGGNLGKVQAMETVVAAADLLRDQPDIHFTLFGSGSMAEWIQNAVATRKLTNFTMGGRQPSEAMANIFAQASALLLTLVDDLLLSQT
ncbi:MAG: glycosyltransferase WbuB, partial [Sphingomonadales bacterium]